MNAAGRFHRHGDPLGAGTGLSLAALAVVAVGLLTLSGIGGGPDMATPTTHAVDTDTLRLQVPASAAAGRHIPITVEGLRTGLAVDITLDTGYGVRPMVVTPDSDRLDVSLPPIAGPASGTAILTVTQAPAPDGPEPGPLPNHLAHRDGTIDRTLVATATLDVEPGPAYDRIDAYLGPRTVIADGTHSVMMVTVPVDQFGNPVAPGTVVDYTVTRADLTVEQTTAPTDHLLSWLEVVSSTVTGRTRVGARITEQSRPADETVGTTGQPTSAERTFLEVAGIPESHALEPLDPIPVADGQALIRLRTTTLADQFGNPLPDGTAVTLDADGAGGIRRINGQTNAGRAEFTYQAPARPGPVTLKATASGVSGRPLTITFDSAVAELTADIEPQMDAVVVNVGPVRSTRDAYVPDGTVATVAMAGPSGDIETRRVHLELGAGSVLFPIGSDATTASVSVLGRHLVVDGPGRLGSITSEAVDGER